MSVKDGQGPIHTFNTVQRWCNVLAQPPGILISDSCIDIELLISIECLDEALNLLKVSIRQSLANLDFSLITDLDLQVATYLVP